MARRKVVHLFRLSQWYVTFEHLQRLNAQGNQFSDQKSIKNQADVSNKLGHRLSQHVNHGRACVDNNENRILMHTSVISHGNSWIPRTYGVSNRYFFMYVASYDELR